MELEERLLALEAKCFVQGELIRALIARTKPDPIRDSPFSVAVRKINGVARDAEPAYQQALAAALADLNPSSVGRLRT